MNGDSSNGHKGSYRRSQSQWVPGVYGDSSSRGDSSANGRRKTSDDESSSDSNDWYPSPSNGVDHQNGSVPASFADLARSPETKHGIHFAVARSKRVPGNVAIDSTSTPHVIAMVGLPARGKTYMSKKLKRYLNWIGVNTKVINLGDYRRNLSNYENHMVFDPNNPKGLAIREKVCEMGLQDALKYLEQGGEVVIFDATNTTRVRRRYLYEKVVLEKRFKLFFIESVCDDENIVLTNIKSCKVTSPDYQGSSEDFVVTDFKQRIAHYEQAYETLDEKLEKDLSFIKIFNAGQKVLTYKHEGHIQSRIVYYLMNIRITPRTIFLTRHGESMMNLEKRIGGDSCLSPRGREYSAKLAEYVNSQNIPNLRVWTSFLRRTKQTAKYVTGVHEKWKTLNELDVGVCDGLTYEEVKEKYPEEFVNRDNNKYRYRYPRGESYEDLVARLEPVIMELEHHSSILVVAHQAVLRCLLGYFMEIDEEKLPYLEVPMHTIIKLEPRAYGCYREDINIDVPAVNTHRDKPSVPGDLTDEFKTSELSMSKNNDINRLSNVKLNGNCSSPMNADHALMESDACVQLL